jgi:hypothetical protein
MFTSADSDDAEGISEAAGVADKLAVGVIVSKISVGSGVVGSGSGEGEIINSSVISVALVVVLSGSLSFFWIKIKSKTANTKAVKEATAKSKVFNLSLPSFLNFLRSSGV